MISSIDHLIIAVKDINDAEENYRKIFGMEPVWKGKHKALKRNNKKMLGEWQETTRQKDNNKKSILWHKGKFFERH